jgi:hypothetical protein
MEHETFRLDRRRAIDDPGRNMNLEARVTRRARHRQTMGEKIPILGDDIEQAQRCLRRDLYQFSAPR